MRRLTTLILLCLLGALGLAACGSDDEEAASSGSAAQSASAPEPGAFPVTIEHKYGSTTIDEAPKRVITVGLREQDALLALGVVPVATSKWLDDTPGQVHPWAKEALGDGKLPEVVDPTNGIQPEAVAAQRPDLIIAVYSGMTKKEYDTLSRIAPVVAMPKGRVDFGSSWQEETLMSGRAVGKPKAAQELVDETEAKIARAAAEHPEFKGASAAVVSDYQGVYVYGPQDVRSRFLEELGFSFPDDLRSVGAEDFGGQLSEERTDLLDLDALVWFVGEGGRRAVERKPGYGDLDVRKEARDVFLAEGEEVYNATSAVSVLSIPLLLEGYVPRLAAAVDGDPATATDQPG